MFLSINHRARKDWRSGILLILIFKNEYELCNEKILDGKSHIPSLLHIASVYLKGGNCCEEKVSYLSGNLLKSTEKLHCASVNQLLACYEIDFWLAGVCINVPMRKEKKMVKERRMKTWTVNFLLASWDFQSMTSASSFSQLDILWYCSPFPILDETTSTERREAAGFKGKWLFPILFWASMLKP